MLHYFAKSKFNETVSLKVEKADPMSWEFGEKFKHYSEWLSQSYLPVEKEFVTQCPTELTQDWFLKSVEPLINQPRVNWSEVEQIIQNILKQFFTEGFFKSLSANKELCENFDHYLSEAFDENNHCLGILYFLKSKQENNCDVRVPVFAVTPNSSNRGVGRLLMESVVRSHPSFKKITLSTRGTNTNAIRAYLSWGFVEMPNSMKHWINMEYSDEDPSSFRKN